MSQKVILVNATNARSGGALQVAVSLLQHWQIHTEVKWIIAAASPVYHQIVHLQSEVFIVTEWEYIPTQNIISMRRSQAALDELVERYQASMALTVFGPAWWQPKCIHVCGFANGYFLYPKSDFIRDYFKNRKWSKWKYNLQRWLVFRQLNKEAHYYWVETADAQLTLAQQLKINADHIAIIPNTYNDALEGKQQKPDFHKNPFVIAVPSAYYPHKQLEIIPKLSATWKDAPRPYRFLICLSEEDEKKVFPHGLPEQIVNEGPLSGHELQDFYHKAHVVLLPTRLEIFSAVFVEAFYTQRPLLTSQLWFAEAICQDGAYYFNPLDVEAIKDGLQKMMTNEQTFNHYIQKGQEQLSRMINPKERAELLWSYMHKILTTLCVG